MNAAGALEWQRRVHSPHLEDRVHPACSAEHASTPRRRKLVIGGAPSVSAGHLPTRTRGHAQRGSGWQAVRERGWAWKRFVEVGAWSPIILISMLACRSGADRTVTRSTTPGGHELVVNPVPEQADDIQQWELVPVRTLLVPDSPEAPGGGFLDPDQMALDGVGRLYVTERNAPFVRVFAADGTFLRTLGKEGEGPGEFAMISGIAVRSDTVFIRDMRLSRTTLVDSAGALLGSWRSMCCYGGLQAATNGLLYQAGEISRGELTEAERRFGPLGFVGYDERGVAHDSLFAPPPAMVPVWDYEVNGQHSIQRIPFSPRTVRILLRSGRMLTGHTDRFRLAIISRDTVRVIEGRTTGAAIPDSVRRTALDAVLEWNPWVAGIAKLGDLPEDYPVWETPYEDDTGSLWVPVASPSGLRVAFQVFDSTGALVATARNPLPDATNWLIEGERAFAVHPDSTGPRVVEFAVRREGRNWTEGWP